MGYMSDNNAVDYANIDPGYVISSASYTYTPEDVEAYLAATEDDGHLYRDMKLVSPMAVAALAMGAISDSISFPDGAVHVSQQMEFYGQVKVSESVICTSKVLARRKRGPFNMLTLGIGIEGNDGSIVYSGKTTVLLPSEKGAR